MNVEIFLVLGLAISASGFCFRDLVHSNVSPYGTVTQFCEYKGLKMTVGSHIKTVDCIECSCTNTGLSCCGYGIKAGVIQPPEGCKVVADGCKVVLVKADDDTKDCFSGKPLVKQ